VVLSRHTRAFLVPIGIAGALVLTATLLPSVLASTVTAGLPVRTLVVLAFAGPLSVLLGMCFPIGVRLIDQTVTAWAWGVNGAFSVLASIVAVAISMWAGIDVNFWIAAAIYLGLTVPLGVLVKRR
jgi:hypothetical protein